jgi:ankyrin repeat protein
MLISYYNPSQSVDFSCLHTQNFSTMTPYQLAKLFQQLRQQRDNVLSVAFHLASAITSQLQDQDAQRKVCLDILYTLVLPNITSRERNTLDRITQRETSSNNASVSEASESKELEPPLHAATRSGDLRLVKQLLADGAAINEQFGPQKLTALMIAAQMGHADVVKLLLDKGASHSLQSEDGRYALDWSFTSQSQPITSILLFSALQKSVTAEHWPECKEQRLCWAALAGDVSATRWLLQQGAGRGKHLPLENAIKAGHSAIVQLLLQHGAEVHGRGDSKPDCTMKHITEASGDKKNAMLIELLLTCPPRHCAIPKDCPTHSKRPDFFPLHLALSHFAPVAVLQMLVIAGADIYQKHPTDGSVKEFSDSLCSLKTDTSEKNELIPPSNEQTTPDTASNEKRIIQLTEEDRPGIDAMIYLMRTALENRVYIDHALALLELQQPMDMLNHSKQKLEDLIVSPLDSTCIALLRKLLDIVNQVFDFELRHRPSKPGSTDFQHVIFSLLNCLIKNGQENLYTPYQILLALHAKYTDNKSLNQQLRMIFIKLVLFSGFKHLRHEYQSRPFIPGLGKSVDKPQNAPQLKETDIIFIDTLERELNAPQLTDQKVLQLLYTIWENPSLKTRFFNDHPDKKSYEDNVDFPIGIVLRADMQHHQPNHPGVTNLSLLAIITLHHGDSPDQPGLLRMLSTYFICKIFEKFDQDCEKIIPDIYLDSPQNKSQRYILRKEMRAAIGGQTPDIAALIGWLGKKFVHPNCLLTAKVSCHDNSLYQQLIKMAVNGTAGEKTRLVREVLFLVNKGLDKALQPLPAQPEAVQLKHVASLLPPGATSEPIQPAAPTASDQTPQLLDTSLIDEVASIQNNLAALAPINTKTKMPANTSFLSLVVYLNNLMRHSTSEKLKSCLSEAFHKTPLEFTVFLERVLFDLSQPPPSMTLDVHKVRPHM